MGIGDGIGWVSAAPSGLPYSFTDIFAARADLYKIDPDDLSVLATLDLQSALGSGSEVYVQTDGLITDGEYIYLVAQSGVGFVNYLAKIAADDLSYVNKWSVAVGEAQTRGPILGPDGYLYSVVSSAISRIYKFDPVTLSLEGQLNQSGVTPYAFAHDGTYLYVASTIDSPGVVRRYDPAEMTEIDTLTLNTGYGSNRDIGYDGKYLYVLCSISPGRIAILDPVTFSQIEGIILDTGYNSPRILGSVYGYELLGDVLYAGLYTSPGRVIGMSMRDFSIEKTATLESGENQVYSLACSASAIFAGTNTKDLVKMDQKLNRITKATLSENAQAMIGRPVKT